MPKRLPDGRIKRSAKPRQRVQSARSESTPIVGEAPAPTRATALSGAPLPTAPASEALPGAPPPTIRPSPSRRRPETSAIPTNYEHVFHDLKYMGILTAGAFGIIAALAFVLR